MARGDDKSAGRSSPSLLGLITPHQTTTDLIRNVGWIWLWLAVAGLLFRTIQLFFVRDVQTGLVWATKILTDPFHDIKLYHRAPIHLFQGASVDDEDAHERRA